MTSTTCKPRITYNNDGRKHQSYVRLEGQDVLKGVEITPVSTLRTLMVFATDDWGGSGG